MAADIELLANPTLLTSTWAAMEVSMARYMLLKTGATARLNRRLLIGHPERVSWLGRHLRKRRGWVYPPPVRTRRKRR